MHSVSPAASSSGAGAGPSSTAASPSLAVSAAASPSRAVLNTLPAPALIALLRSSYRSGHFNDVSEILAAREKSAVEASSRCTDLERQLRDGKDRYAQLEAKYGAVEESAENYRRVTELLQECQVISEDENAALRARVLQGQERIAQLEEQLQGSEMSKFVELKVEVQDYKCGKLRAEEAAEDWKRRYTDAQARVVELSDEILALRAKTAVVENDKDTLREAAVVEDEGDDYDGDDEVEEENEGDKEGENGPELMRLSSAGDVATVGENSTLVQPPEEGTSVKLNLDVKAGFVKEEKVGVASSGVSLSAKSEGVSKEGGASVNPHCLIVLSDSEEEDGDMVGNDNHPGSVSVCGGNVDTAAGEGNAYGANSAAVSTQRVEGDPSVANRGEDDDDEDDTVPLVELKKKRMSEVASPGASATNKTQSGTTLELKRKRVSGMASPEPNSFNKTQSGTTSELKRNKMSVVAIPEPNFPNKMQSGTASELKRKRISDVVSPELNSPTNMQSDTASKLKRNSMSAVTSPEPNSSNKMQSSTASELKRNRVSVAVSPKPNSPNKMQSGTASELKRNRMSDVASPELNSPTNMQSGTALELKRNRMSAVMIPETNPPNKMQSGTASELKSNRMSDVASPEPSSPNKMQSGTPSDLKWKRMSDVASPHSSAPNGTQYGITSELKRKGIADAIQRSEEPNVPDQMQSGTTLDPKRKRMPNVMPGTPEPNASREMHSGTASSEKFSSRQLQKRRKILTPVAIYDARRP